MTIETLFTSFGGILGIILVYWIKGYFEAQKKKSVKLEESINKDDVANAVQDTKLNSHEERITHLENKVYDR